MMCVLLIIILLLQSSCATCCTGGWGSEGMVQYGIASYYGDEFHGKRTASGEMFNKWEYTCAHKTLAFNTKVKITNLSNNKSIVVRVNDRGPFIKGRIVDLSYAAAKKIDLVKCGTARVKLEVIK